MKNLFLSIAILSTFFFMSCDDGEEILYYEVPVTFDIQVGDEVILQYGEEYWALDMNSVEDSRCPEDVMCIWEGYAEVALTSGTSSSETEFGLHTMDNDTGTFPLSKYTEVNGFSYELIELLPGPGPFESPTSQENYIMTLEVRPLE